jgi:dienelactone hydrolase
VKRVLCRTLALLAGCVASSIPLPGTEEVQVPPVSGAPPIRRGLTPEQWTWNNPVPVPLVEHGTIHSGSMQREVGYNIYLPPEYAQFPDRRYSVVYFLHGARGTEETGAQLASVTQRELEAGRTGPVIWVYVNGGPFSGYYDWAESYVKAETMFLRELIPAIESRYRVRTDRAGRGICGYSMGGNGAVRLAAKFPDRFCAAASIAGAFSYYAGNAGDDTVFHWTRLHMDRLRGRLPLWFFIGAKDQLKVDQTRYFALLDELEMGYRSIVVPGAGHLLGEIWDEVCPEFVRVMANACSPPDSR